MSLRFAPPPTFPLYGLDSPDVEHRALDWVEVHIRSGRSTTSGIWLAHLTSTGGVRVGSFDPAALAMEEENPMVATARRGATALVDLTIPTRDRTVAPVVAAHVRSQLLPNADWDTSELDLEGESVPTRTWSFAGGWTCVADVDHIALCAVGIGTPPDRLRLQQISTSSAYGFDYEAPIDRLHHREEQRIWQESLLTPPNSDLHEDHRKLLEQQL